VIDHRGLQRGLFRMQMDAGFAARVFAREQRALASLDLRAPELDLLLALDPVAVGADAHERRKDQMLGNLSAEYGLTLAVAPSGLAPGFLSAPEFHAAIRADGLLPVAFGDYAARTAADDAPVAALIALERAMVALRRAAGDAAPPTGGERLRLSPRAALVRIRTGALAWAAALRDALRMHTAPPPPDFGAGLEVVLLLAEAASAHALPDVRPEVLTPAVALLLERARTGLDRAARADLARELDATPDELEAFAQALVDDGVLIWSESVRDWD
jgi:hypothetical protein